MFPIMNCFIDTVCTQTDNLCSPLSDLTRSIHSNNICNDSVISDNFESDHEIDDHSPDNNFSQVNCKYRPTTTYDLASVTLDCSISYISIVQSNRKKSGKKFDHLKLLLQNFKNAPTIISLSETWCHDINEGFYSIPDYNLQFLA